MSGWVKLHRKALASAVWANQDLWRFWSWCLMKAAYKPSTTLVKFKPVRLLPGQFVFSRALAAGETGLSERTVRTCLQTLNSLGTLSVAATNVYSLITITNWSAYQDEAGQVGQLTAKARPGTAQPLKRQEGKKDKTSGAGAAGDFEIFWAAYPKKRAKGAALAAWRKLDGTKTPLETLLLAIAAQKAGHDWQKDGGQYIPYPATWLNQRRWEDDLGEVESGPEKPTGLSDAELEYLLRGPGAGPGGGPGGERGPQRGAERDAQSPQCFVREHGVDREHRAEAAKPVCFVREQAGFDLSDTPATGRERRR